MFMRLSLLILLLICSNAWSADPPLTLYDEGVKQGVIFKLDCVGAGVSCSQSGTTGTFMISGGGSGGNVTINTTSPLTGADTNTTFNIGINKATTSADGYLSSTDFTTFNNKQPAGNYITNVGIGTANTITFWPTTDTIGSLPTATYPSLTELSYVKGVTSAIQTQLNGKQASGSYLTDVTADSPLSGSGTSGSHLTLDTSGTWSGNAVTATTASTVTTNANLTGPITSVGNATSIASQTGTGTKFVVDTSPTISTPILTGTVGIGTTLSSLITGLSVMTGNVGIGTWNARNTLDVKGNIVSSGTIGASNFSGTSSGTNTGDQTLPTECSTSSCNLNSATTLNSKTICLNDGTNCTSTSGGFTDGGPNVYTSTTTDNVGIGTTTPNNSQFEIVKNAANRLFMVSSVATGKGDLLTVLTNGNVGIGTINPARKFFIQGTGISYFGMKGTASNDYVEGRITNDANASMDFGVGGTNTGDAFSSVGYFNTNSSSLPFTIFTNNTKRMHFNSADANVGIGTTVPNSPFEIRNTTNNIWSVQSAANQACNTTCIAACVFGQDTGGANKSIVACSDATADICVCAGSN